jgi:hypothetical protein
VIWLQSPPWGRWIAATVIAVMALWVELGPDPVADHPFAISEIAPGDLLTTADVVWKSVPVGLFDPVSPDSVLTRTVDPGEPILASDVGNASDLMPTGWWIIAVDLTVGAKRGDRAKVVMLDTLTVASAIVVSAATEDPLGGLAGAVAVEPDLAAEAAAAAAEGRLAVMVETR